MHTPETRPRLVSGNQKQRAKPRRSCPPSVQTWKRPGSLSCSAPRAGAEKASVNEEGGPDLTFRSMHVRCAQQQRVAKARSSCQVDIGPWLQFENRIATANTCAHNRRNHLHRCAQSTTNHRHEGQPRGHWEPEKQRGGEGGTKQKHLKRDRGS